MQLRLVEENGASFVEGDPGVAFMMSDTDATLIIEACFGHRVDGALLYSANLTPAFFDLSSREAGNVLQKLRNYHMRLAVVLTPGDVQQSSKFGEMLAEEQRGQYFGVFSTRDAAVKFLYDGQTNS